MGGEYRITGDKYPRMRRPPRRPRFVLAIVASALVVGLIGWGTLQLIDVFSGGGDKATAASADPACTPGPTASPSPAAEAKPLPKPDRITVNVFNATPRSGLAKSTAEALEKRGFRIGEVANASEKFDKKVPGTALLLGAKSATDAALPVLGTQLPGAELRTDARAKPTEVDFIIGDGFKALAKQPDADQALKRLTAPQPTPTATRSC
ncbi:LytR C-terminal domain-containing protein [Streptomyces sp. CRN 30]|uniref:LytR C-terminal domain-containing protein n=1 Tax=Streptomyces sp. CRN 30 TaxID=3075613 RepID=UPI002A7F9809|nr:LytR C-terminal domain-containing protein [Streptomyces sp. CRN 30]